MQKSNITICVLCIYSAQNAYYKNIAKLPIILHEYFTTVDDDGHAIRLSLFCVCVCIYDNKPVCRFTKTMFKVFLDDKRQKDTW